MCAAKSGPTIFSGFFSYAHHDALTDPGLVKALTKSLEDCVNGKLANARLKIWRDTEGLRTGTKWNDNIAAQLTASHVMIVLLTPRWIESEYCRREYTIFEQIESEREIGEYIAPILARPIEEQEKHLTEEQREVYERINSRQYLKVDEVFKHRKADRDSFIERLADDVLGMVERLRNPTPERKPQNKRIPRPRKTREFDALAQNYERVDFVTDGELVLDRPNDRGQRSILAHVGFIERLYIEGERGRIEFGVRRAFISVENAGPGTLAKSPDLKGTNDLKNVYYTTLHEARDAVTVCIDPAVGKTSLTELPLPPATNENYLSKIATASSEVETAAIKGELVVSLNVEGLYVFGHKGEIAPRTEAAIKAIMGLVRTKAALANRTIDDAGLFRRKLPVRERT